MASLNIQDVGPIAQIPAPLAKLTTVRLSVPTEHVLLVAMARPKALNVFNEQMEDEMRQVLEWAEQDKDVWTMVLTGEGGAFCAGGDLKPALTQLRDHPSEPIPPAVFYGPTSEGFGYLSRRPKSTKPVIAAVNGMAFGGGLEIVLNCDIVIASDKAKFGFPETKNGLVAIHGAVPRISRIAGHQRASEAYLMGRTLSAKEAHARFGFVNRVVPHDFVLSSALGIAAQVVSLATSASQNAPGTTGLEQIQATKQMLNQSRNWGPMSMAKL
ncbi:enoyl-CoA hydratase/carnithine racemase [Phanerochaete sordida]|uniref:Enoyl-CoA hydratase/carnithine racemase n=1 Tax=Phanerochaete sordida TaxID=48140 RepID=A0A9P3GIX5_9APHY|nr:enoyl-CoA hydratase/carnithine racemase [Phanerochaete sordida]